MPTWKPVKRWSVQCVTRCLEESSWWTDIWKLSTVNICKWIIHFSNKTCEIKCFGKLFKSNIFMKYVKSDLWIKSFLPNLLFCAKLPKDGYNESPCLFWDSNNLKLLHWFSNFVHWNCFVQWVFYIEHLVRNKAPLNFVIIWPLF